jgi:CPA1 family monovalent cation:H+ antiporter
MPAVALVLSQRHHRRHERDEAYADAARETRNEMLIAERAELVRLRDNGSIADDVLRRIHHELDLEQMLVGGSSDVMPER